MIKCSTRKGWDFLANIKQGSKLSGEKHYSLIRHCVSDEMKKGYKVATTLSTIELIATVSISRESLLKEKDQYD
jgi:hypothetical protein